MNYKKGYFYLFNAFTYLLEQHDVLQPEIISIQQHAEDIIIDDTDGEESL